MKPDEPEDGEELTYEQQGKMLANDVRHERDGEMDLIRREMLKVELDRWFPKR